MKPPASHALPKGARLLRRRQFQYVMQQGARASSSLVSLNIIRRTDGPTRMGVTVSRRFGKAHQRNRFKRLVREAFRLSRSDLPTGIDFNVLPGPQAQKATLTDIRADLSRLLNKKGP